MIDVRPVLRLAGQLLCALAVAMLLPAALDLHDGQAEARAFVVAAGITLLVGLALALGMNGPRPAWTIRQIYLAVVAAWAVPVPFAALPLAWGTAALAPLDALFEAASGLTGSGATVLVGLDHLPRGLLLWRALLNWLGGLGVIAMVVAVLPALAIGGMQLFRVELPGAPERALARGRRIAAALFAFYAGLTLLLALGLWRVGLSGFEACAQALSTLSAGGFSTSDASIGHFHNPAAELLLTAGMVAAGLPVLLYYRLARGEGRALLGDSQIGWYLALLGLGGFGLAAWLWISLDRAPAEALRQGAFTVASVMSGTGFTIAPVATWGGLPAAILFFLAFVGGCAGSAGGGMKVFRLQCLFTAALIQLRRLLRPHSVQIVTFNRRPIGDGVVESVLGFLFVYALSFALLAMALAFFGVDFVTAIGGAAAALANLGPGVSYAGLPDAAKPLLMLGMLLGRVEIFPLLVLFAPAFWRQ
ncbi:TrkH family potassium uptake protein [Phaeospirillum tilakii]|uniref:Trk system potassium uptake protein n=1 Tax=Phaeospirillum tilakii TaxID=741673 RepID=A0ABW5CDI2_9PROT